MRRRPPAVVDHVAVPEGGRALRRPRVALPLKRRTELAVRLLAAGVVLLEADLWPTVAAARRAGLDGPRDSAPIMLGRAPVPLERILRGRRGGQERFERACAAWAEAVRERLHLAPWTPAPGRWGLEAWLEPLLARLPLPLPRDVAGSLWGLAARPLPVPAAGELACWRSPTAELAVRLGRELARRESGAGTGAWCLVAGIEEGDTVPRPPVGARGLLVTAGVIGPDDMAAAERWAAQPECASVVVGLLPPGWEEAATVVPAVSGGGLVLAGGEPVQRGEVRARLGLEDGLHAEENRERLNAAAAWRWEDRPPEEEPVGPIEEVLRLVPEGLPEPAVLALSGAGPGALERLMSEGRVIKVRERWRLRHPRKLHRDRRHIEIAAACGEGDPRGFLHRALGGEDGSLVAWMKARLEALEGREVERLLANVVPGALGERIAVLHAEACLLGGNAAAALRAISAGGGAGAGPVKAWCRVLDGEEPSEPGPRQIEAAPLAAAVAAMLTWRRRVRSGTDPGPWPEIASRAASRLAGGARDLVTLVKLYIEDRDRFRGQEGRRLAGRNRMLRQEWLHLVAFVERDRGRFRAARRALRSLTADPAAVPPGKLGLILLDLGSIELLLENRDAADRCHRAAMRRLEAAGLPGRAEAAAFNLAVSELDDLRIERAAERFHSLETPGNDPFLLAELARIELARGDLPACRRGLERIDVDRSPLGVREAAALLEGVLALFDGRPDHAREMLGRAGSEGQDWSILLDAVEGREAPGAATAPDGWGVRLAATLVTAARNGEPADALFPEGIAGRREALAVALADRLLPPGTPLPAHLKLQARRILEREGMGGWAGGLERRGEGTAAIEAFSWVAEMGSLEGIPETLVDPLLSVLGVEGLEVRHDGAVLRLGETISGTETEIGGIRLAVPPGTDTSTPAWRLLTHLLLPAATVPGGSAMAGDVTGLVGSSTAMASVRADLAEFGPSSLSVLVQGETGTGKELAARALHRLSRRPGRFVALNVAAVPENLVESELFGSAKGAFTGAESRQGLVAAADGGTLFLDEIGELDPRLQAKLLRFLETREVRPVGSTRSRRIDVRIVSATHQDLERMMEEGRFRRDLYYRLATVTIRIPPLRERLEDLPELVDALAARLVAAGEAMPARWSPAALERLRGHRWEGNVRELAHVVAVAMTRARGGLVRPEHLLLPGTGDRPQPRRWSEAMDELRRRLVSGALERAGGNRSAAARELGISRQTLLYHMERLGIRATGG